MKIEVRNLKVAASLSEETTAYTATIYVDGKAAFHASNHGQGGCDFYHPVQGYHGPSEREVSNWLKANMPPVDMSQYGTAPLPMDLELFVSEQIEKAEAEKRLNRLLKRKIVTMRDGALYTWKAEPTPANFPRIRLKPGEIIVNTASPEIRAQALAMV